MPADDPADAQRRQVAVSAQGFRVKWCRRTSTCISASDPGLAGVDPSRPRTCGETIRRTAFHQRELDPHGHGACNVKRAQAGTGRVDAGGTHHSGGGGGVEAGSNNNVHGQYSTAGVSGRYSIGAAASSMYPVLIGGGSLRWHSETLREPRQTARRSGSVHSRLQRAETYRAQCRSGHWNNCGALLEDECSRR